MADRLMTLERDLTLPIGEVVFPKEYALVNDTENCRHLWEIFMDECFGGYQAGSFRWVYVNNYNYADDRVYVLLNAENKPIATSNSWQTLDFGRNIGYISWIGVLEGYRGRSLGVHMTNYCLYDMKKRGFKTAIITTDKENHRALKTYIKCGFTPRLTSAEEIQHWEEICSSMSSPVPAHDRTIHPNDNTPHPLPPWPYQLAAEKAAVANGHLFIHGLWNRFNMYQVIKAEYGKLECLFSGDKVALKWLNKYRDNDHGEIYIDFYINPRAALIINKERESYQFGLSRDGCFEDGLILFRNELAEKPEQSISFPSDAFGFRNI